jgi:hypothetical protein
VAVKKMIGEKKIRIQDEDWLEWMCYIVIIY